MDTKEHLFSFLVSSIVTMPSVRPFGFYVYRQHLLPIDSLFDLNTHCANAKTTEAFLRQLFQKPVMQEAIYVASPSLYARMQAWLNSEQVSEAPKLLKTLFKYYLRASSRCTPFGMFAGYAVGTISEDTNIVPNSDYPPKKHIQIDFGYLSEIVKLLLSDSTIKNQLRFYSNNTIYKVANDFHYLFYATKDQNRIYSICSVDANPYTTAIIEKAKNGVLITELIAYLIATENIDPEEAEDFISQMIDEQLLFSEIEPTIYGEDFLRRLLQKLKNIRLDTPILYLLERIDSLLHQRSTPLPELQKTHALLTNLLGNVERSVPFQTTLQLQFKQLSISRYTFNDLSSKIAKLLVLNQGKYNDELLDFKKRFHARYENTQVPLAIALDDEMGIGYGHKNTIKDGFISAPPVAKTLALDNSIYWVFWKEFTTKKYFDALYNQSSTIILTDEDLKELETKNIEFFANIPATFQVFGSLFEQNGQASFYLKNMIGPSAVSLMARFANNDDDLTHKLRNCTQYEENKNPDVIFADIVHIPEALTANIATRPQLLRFEIPYQTLSAQPTEYQISIDDLMVSVNQKNEVVLTSKKHHKQVIPRLSSAHNYNDGLSTYRFLCHLQQSYESLNAFWHWHLFKSYPFLPRVQYKNVILSPATWNIPSEEFSLNDIKTVQTTFKVPRYVTISETDNELWIDLENTFCLDILKDILAKNKTVMLKEVLATPQNCLNKASEGNFTNEIVIPFENVNYKPYTGLLQGINPNLQRDFSIGNEWLYLKIYCGEKMADKLLSNEINAFVDSLLAINAISQFFFVRYEDPDFHLRLRFKGNSAGSFETYIIQHIYQLLKAPLKEGSVYKIQVNSYKREVERYGEKTMNLSEELFFRDSLHILQFLEKSPSVNKRICYAICRIRYFLNAFQITEQKDFVAKIRQQFLEEFENGIELCRQLNKKVKNGFLLDINDAFLFSDIDTVATSICEKTPNETDRIHLIASYIHMFVNRLFVSDNRFYELATYHFLLKNLSKTIYAKSDEFDVTYV